MKKKSEYEDSLKQSGLKNTKHRIAILEILNQSEQPISAEQVYFELKEKNISINLSIVYRTLEILTDKSLLLKINIANESRALFEYNRMVHKHYLVCIGCKKMLTINKCPLEDYEKVLEKETDFVIFGHKLDIYGYCPECQKKGGAI
jgi:Fur family ferric uptake transcriptional regulator